MRSYLCTFILSSSIIVLFLVGCQQSTEKKSTSSSLPEVEEKAAERNDDKMNSVSKEKEIMDQVGRVGYNMDTVLGAWIRPDGNYVLEIHVINEDLTLKANYFNPRPINISLAQIKKEDRIKIFVEFDDVNYKGSYYDLQYDPVNDALRGNYYQATYGQTYPIAFIRYEAPDQ